MKSAAQEAQDATWMPLRQHWLHGYRSPLARRIAVITIGCSSLLALMMTGLQLYADFRGERSVLLREVADIEKSIVPGLVESLWILDDALIRSQLKGIVRKEGVEHAEVVDADGRKIVAGENDGAFSQHHAFSLDRGSGPDTVMLGTLHLFVSFDAIIDRVIQRAVLIFSTNALKTFLVVAVILLIYQMLIGRHIAWLATFASGYDPENPPQPLVLNRRPASIHGDELAKLESAVNHLIDANRGYIDKLQDAKDAIAESHAELQRGHEALKSRTDELDATNKKLHVANREQAEFTYAISHDLKSPAVSLGMLLGEIWEESHERLDPDAIAMFKRAQQLIDRMGRQVDSVLDYSKTVAKDFDFEAVDLNQTLADVVEDLSGIAKAAGASIEIAELPVVYGNSSLLSMLFLNLLSNALKFRDPDRSPRISVAAQTGESPEIVCISVRDNGIGIAKDHHEQIFGLFKRLHLQSAFPGSGIGLALCQRIVVKHEGTIDVKSDIGLGTTFLVTLKGSEPIRQASETISSSKAIGNKAP